MANFSLDLTAEESSMKQNTTNLDKPLEGLLRPPVEWYSAGIALLIAMCLKIYPHYFFIPSDMFHWIDMGLILLAIIRFWQGYKVMHYQWHLKKSSVYELNSEQLPIVQNQLFLGQGFLWEPIHTQRLRDLDLAYNREYIHTNSEESGYAHLHGVSLKEKDVFIDLRDRGHHLLVLGTTGVGKTRFAEILIGQDIRRGDVVIVLDPKGDFDLLRSIVNAAKMVGREKSVRMIHLGFPEQSCRYNPIGFFTKITQVATRIANALPSSGEAAAFKEFSWKYVNLVTRGLFFLKLIPTYRLINFYLTKLDQLFIQIFEKMVEENKDLQMSYQSYVDKEIAQSEASDKEIFLKKLMFTFAQQYVAAEGHNHLTDERLQLLNDLVSACRLDRSYYDKVTASIGPLLEKLTTGAIADLFSPNYDDPGDLRPIIDWMGVIQKKQIVYIGMDALTDPIISSVVGNALLSDLVATAGHLYKFPIDSKPQPIHVHADEFNEVIGDEFIPLLNKARGAGFDITAYTQTWSDVEARLNSKAKAGQVAGNLGAVIMFRCKEAKTVDMLREQLPKVSITRVIPASSSSDHPKGYEGIYFSSSNEDRLTYETVSLLEQNDVLNLPKGQAFALLQGGKLYKLRMPLPKKSEVIDQGESTLPAISDLLAQIMEFTKNDRSEAKINRSMEVTEEDKQWNESKLLNVFLTWLALMVEAGVNALILEVGLLIDKKLINQFLQQQKLTEKCFMEELALGLYSKKDKVYFKYKDKSYYKDKTIEGIIIARSHLTEEWKMKSCTPGFVNSFN